jgi:hypothetical protein
MNNFKIINLCNPQNSQDAVTKLYVDTIFPNITSGTFNVVTVNDMGLITSGESRQLLSGDILDFDTKIDTHKITDLSLPDKNLNMNNNRIINLNCPINDSDAVPKEYIDSLFPNITPHTYTKVQINEKGLVIFGTNITENDIPNITSSKISDLDENINSHRITDLNEPNQNLNMNGYKIINLNEPELDTDAANKSYIDNKFQNTNPGTYTKVMINNDGLVQLGMDLKDCDIP